MEINGERVFLPAEYVEAIGWEKRLVTGRARKQKIRSFALNSMPNWTIDKLINGYKEAAND